MSQSPRLQIESHVVLVVDDNVDAVEMLTILIEADGHTAVTAYSGREAIEVAKRTKPDVVLLDISLPDMDGFEVCRRLREEHVKGHTCIVAITGWAGNEQRAEAMRVGFDEYLVKPVEFARVLQALRDCRSHTTAPAAA
ncbi:response regulator [Ramlibacter rhizophilus]|uniref:Response regulator n=1 Tax=Ramlibacter rhizophilus TaxID=1781167 RepID=A0A4Z0BDW0_9BURK|nr:response regulator [Ramlibacter rhizophilus]TFY97515.1 response regulator [Ramlibacter rhizophilus]